MRQSYECDTIQIQSDSTSEQIMMQRLNKVKKNINNFASEKCQK